MKMNAYHQGRIAACFIIILLGLRGQLFAQTQVTSPMTGTPAAGSYFSYSNIVLNPNFSFTASAGNSLKLYIANPDCQPLANNYSQNQNYVVTTLPRTAMGTFSTAGLTSCDLMQTIAYFDGLGRPLQTIQVKGSTTNKDVVQPFAYDQFGREAIKYLPYAAQGTADGSYKSNAVTDQNTFYNSPPSGSGVSQITVPFSLINFEPSPLNRVKEHGAPGAAWQPVANSTAGHTNKVDYTSNNTTALSDVNNSYFVALYTVSINNDQSRTLNHVSGASYPAGELYVTINKDENWVSGKPGTIEEYTDKDGHVVLKRTFNLVGTTVQVQSTYYVYDDLGNLAFVLPPNSGADATLPIQTTLDNICYQYQYDDQNRMVQKKLPGKGWEYMVYNLLDKVIYTQDANQRINSPQSWSFIKYDVFGRIVMTGTEGGHTETRKALQDNVTTNLKNSLSGYTEWETPNSSGTHGYTNTAFPNGPQTTVLIVNYFDSYNNIPNLPVGYQLTTGVSTMTKGLITATKTAVLNNPSDYLWTVNYYDDKGRDIQSFKQHYLGGVVSPYNFDQTTNIYNDITGELINSKREHYTKNTANTDKVKAVTITNGYVFDHMGRRVQIKKQINTGSNILLSQIDYNEIGQVQTKHLHGASGAAPFMQDIAYNYNERGWMKSSNSPLFSMQLTYNNGNTMPFNGNISNQSWQVQGGANRSYNYTYDALNRLTSGISNEGYDEKGIDYDLAGNIQHLTRQNSMYTYNYTGNQLQTVTGLTTGTYQYDPNGNVKFDARNQKNYTYNLLNLPQNITATGFNLSYTYDATGQKLRKNNGAITTDYIGGIQYENGNIIFIQTEEGRAINNGGNYLYEYSLTDHLGNARLIFDQNSATTIRQQEDYYPFGMEISRGTAASPKNDYLYNRKELQTELGQYDYGARFYDPVIGRWNAVDPLAEVSRRWSTYNYGNDNPLRFIDPDGRSTESWKKENHITDGDLDHVYQAEPEKDDDQSNKEPDKSTGADETGGGQPAPGPNGVGPKDKTNVPINPASGLPYQALKEVVVRAKPIITTQKPILIKGEGSGGIRAPDYVNVSLSLPVLPPGVFTGNLVTWNISASIDRYGIIHWSPIGFAVGKSWVTIASASVTANWLNQATIPSQTQLNNFLTGHGSSFTGGYWGGGTASHSPGNGWAFGGGLVTPQFGGSYNYTPEGNVFNIPTSLKW